MTVNYYNRFITVTSHSIYTNKTAVPINDMVFIIYPAIFQSIYTKAVHLADSFTPLEYTWDTHRMRIALAAPLQPGEKIEIVHEYELYMPDREGVFGQTGRQLNLSYWFPTIPPYDEQQGWLVHDISLVNSMIVGEHQVFEAADFDVTLQFTDRRENMKIAAGVIPEETDGILHYQMQLARTFTISISDIFHIAEREVNGVKVLSYTFPEEAAAGEAAADIAVQAIEVYSDLYGPLNRNLLSVVEADFLHGMEFDGLVLLSRGFYMFYNDSPQSNLTIITPHETSHQWFFSMVGNDQAMEPWLDESLATYSELLYYERYYPDLVQWWWDNRVDGYGAYGWVDNSIYLDGGYDEYRNSVYFNGAHFLQDVRVAVGDSAFFSFLKDYVNTYRYEIASSEDFWSMLKAHTDADLTAIHDEYFETPLE